MSYVTAHVLDSVAGTLGLTGRGGPAWNGLDVGSPFDFEEQSALYLPTHLPDPAAPGFIEAEGGRHRCASFDSRPEGPRLRMRRLSGL